MNCNEKYILHIENSRAEPVIWENLGKYGGTDMLGTYKIRTDLAVEARERFTEDNVEVRGVEVQEDYNEEKDIRTTVVKITTENGARAMGRPQGTYITIESEGLSAPDEDYHREVSEELSRHLRQLIGLEKEKSVLIVGLGNPGITADSLGPEVIGNLHMTRHLIREYGLKSTEKQILHAISGIVPGVSIRVSCQRLCPLRRSYRPCTHHKLWQPQIGSPRCKFGHSKHWLKDSMTYCKPLIRCLRNVYLKWHLPILLSIKDKRLTYWVGGAIP